MTARARRSTKRPVVVTVGEELTIQYAAETAAQLMTALEKAGPPAATASAAPALRLDLSAVQELDTAGLQVLLWAAREARSREVTLEVLASEPVLEVATLTGIEPERLGLQPTGGAR